MDSRRSILVSERTRALSVSNSVKPLDLVLHQQQGSLAWQRLFGFRDVVERRAVMVRKVDERGDARPIQSIHQHRSALRQGVAYRGIRTGGQLLQVRQNKHAGGLSTTVEGGSIGAAFQNERAERTVEVRFLCIVGVFPIVDGHRGVNSRLPCKSVIAALLFLIIASFRCAS